MKSISSMNYNTRIQPYEVTSIHAKYLDCCLPDYFQGSSDAYEVLAVPMRANITFKETREECENEFHNSSGYFDEVSGSGTLVEDALHNLFSGLENPNAPADFAKYIEDDDDECTVYLYIGLFAESHLGDL